MCRMLFNNGQPNALSIEAAKKSAAVAKDYVNYLVNGNFETYVRSAPVGDKIATCLSIICALSKEFNLDWADENVAIRPIDEQKDYLAAFGAYLELPLRTLSDLMKRVRYAGRRKGVGTFQKHLDDFVAIFDPVDWMNESGADPRVLLSAYLATAMYAHRLWCYRQTPARPLPWSLRASKSGKTLYLRYSYYRKKMSKVDNVVKSHMDYKLRFQVPAITSSGIRELQMMCYGSRKDEKNPDGGDQVVQGDLGHIDVPAGAPERRSESQS